MIPRLPQSVQRRRRLLVWTCVVLWLTAAVLSHIPAARLPPRYAPDYVLHTGGFWGLATSFWVCLWAFGLPRWRRIVAVFFILAVYGALDELTQPYFHRVCDIRDWACDVLGVFAAIVICELAAAILFRGPRAPAAEAAPRRGPGHDRP